MIIQNTTGQTFEVYFPLYPYLMILLDDMKELKHRSEWGGQKSLIYQKSFIPSCSKSPNSL